MKGIFLNMSNQEAYLKWDLKYNLKICPRPSTISSDSLASVHELLPLYLLPTAHSFSLSHCIPGSMPNMVVTYFGKSENIWYFTNFKKMLTKLNQGLWYLRGQNPQPNYYRAFFLERSLTEGKHTFSNLLYKQGSPQKVAKNYSFPHRRWILVSF